MKLKGKLYELQVRAEEIYRTENDVEKVLVYLRSKETFIMDSAKILSLILDKPLQECIQLVLHSATWADKRQSIETFQNAFFYGIDEMTDDESL